MRDTCLDDEVSESSFLPRTEDELVVSCKGFLTVDCAISDFISAVVVIRSYDKFSLSVIISKKINNLKL